MARKKDKPTPAPDVLDAVKVEAERQEMPKMEAAAEPTAPSGLVKEAATPAAVETPELQDTIEALEVEAERNPMPKMEAQAAPLEESGLAGEPPVHEPPVEQPVEQPAVSVPPVGFRPVEGKSFAQQALQWRDDFDARLAEEKQLIDQEKKAAKITGFAELGSALANLFGVAEGNAVSQTHKQYSQDWMRKADADAKEHRNRIDDLRARQKDIEYRMAQLKQNQLRDLVNEQHLRRQDELARQKAILDAKLKEGEMALNEYKAETERLRAAASASYNDARTAVQRSNAAQSWAKLAAEQDKHTNAMIQKGWVPDPKAEGGFRYDPKEAKRRYGVTIDGADTSTAAATQPATPAIKQGFAWNPQGAQEQKPGWSLGGETPQEEKKEGQQNAAGNKKKSKLDNYQ